ncbi:MAG TPA: HAMP domain-containing sensor histidine kinase [Ignavibacteriales bacterium]|nr:HAMP domain-containing sensor histidine kinase [Ignavibacteriales bacterium]HOL80401.1 HAMP domain-containing sensor histidine kinase [Ignavibacteriales bacterium]HOM64852.1 HAMP domain-containing sensor histidine kinase [Ignavibacteriales bacterium]HPD67415.1 HAMP domain-containing sensor histidine kinase [Ignavibacteriales bacterium]HPP32590.1 HAMP domain-containing sensor histidine kinase [Ignavibacteriales bacterium]
MLCNHQHINKNYIEKYFEEREKYYRIIGVNLTTEEQNKYYAFFIDDITDLRRQQKLLELTSEKLAGEITEKNTLISILAHDLKNPFNAILNYIEMLTIFKDNPEKVNSTIDKLKNITSNTYKFFENLLTLIKIQTNRVSLNSEKIKINNLIEEVINDNQIIADLKKIRITKQCINIIVNYDYMMIYTIVNNILSNAIKYSYSDSEVKVKV